ncbi:MAG: GGDEF domain-containing protein [Ruminococcus sp.]|nr:GGDEF domain-containing protein [Ruminococcus sp.]
MEFYILFEQLLKALSSQDPSEFHKVKDTLSRLCRYLRIAKISTTTYGNKKLEALNRGDVTVSYDSGEPCREGFANRLVTDMMTVVVCRAFIPEGEPDWNDEELDRIKLVIDMMTVFISRSRIQQAAERYAFFDDDGYHNLRYFIRFIERTAQEGKLLGMAAIHFNLKHFSLVNQQVGRSAGSVAMHEYFDLLSKNVGEGGEVCRIGGDNFALLCHKEKLDDVIRILNGAAVEYNQSTGDRIIVSATAGVFIIPEDFIFNDAGDILDKIITTSNAARSGGKEDVLFYSNLMAAGKERMMRIQRIFPTALQNEEFKVFYQPKIDITTGELIGAEALCRWFRDGQIVPPMEFIPVLEQGLDICRLDFYMLDHVCRDIRRWLDEGKQVVRVSVNLSRKHMMDVDLLQRIIEIVDKNNVPHKFVEIELTETTTDVEFRDLKRVVSGLQQAGISTSVDDFGMGYSSLNLIKEIPWNVLKVDKSFLPVEDDDENSTRSVMFKYVIAMAKEMGLECIAEGVETQSQVDVLRENHCELAQGFFFDRPLPVEEFEKRLTVHKYTVK